MEEARRNDEVISLADSQVLRWIDELNSLADSDARAKEIKGEIKQIRKEPNSILNRKRIQVLYSELDCLQFKPDYFELIIDKPSDYYRACKGLSINNVKYKRLLGTNGGIKNSTIVFVSERLSGELRKRVENGRNQEMELVTAKLEAHKALTCSASIPVSMPNGILVVPDCETNFITDYIYLSSEGDGEPVMEERHNQEFTVDASDGCGMMLPSLAERWSAELLLGYTTSGVCLRMAFTKGMAFTFDFIDFAHKVAGDQYVVRDAWGDEVDIRNVELVLTTSMLKLWDSYESCADWLSKSIENHYTFAVTKACSDKLENERNLNYQFIQSIPLDDDDIEELIEPTMTEIKDVLGGDWRRAVLFMEGSGLTENNIDRLPDDEMKAVMVDHRMLNDPYICNIIYQAIRKRIDDAKIGVLKVHGNYSMASGDLYALCQSIWGMRVTGLLGAGQVYNKYWSDDGTARLACFRAPMSCPNNIRLVEPSNNEDVQYWYRHMNACTVFNAWDTAMAALNGMDFDGDLVMLTDNKALLNRLVQQPALMCVQRKAEKRVATEEDFIRSNIESFGNEIGQITNRVTSMYEIRSRFSPDSEEYKVLSYRIQCGQLLQQDTIDRSKGIICKPMPKNWYDRHAVNRMEDKNDKRLYREVVADRKPYFMRYIYPTLMKEYNTYVKNANENCITRFSMTLEEMRNANSDTLTGEQSTFLHYYNELMPVGTSDCVMNKICRRFEEEFDGYIGRYGASKKFDYTIMKSSVEYSLDRFYKIKRIYEDYSHQLRRYMSLATADRVSSGDIQNKIKMMNDEFMEGCYEVCSDEKALCNIVLDLCYKRTSTKKFAWEICGSEIIQNLLEKNDYTLSFPKQTDNGEISYGGNMYNEMNLNVSEWKDDLVDMSDVFK